MGCLDRLEDKNKGFCPNSKDKKIKIKNIFANFSIFRGTWDLLSCDNVCYNNVHTTLKDLSYDILLVIIAHVCLNGMENWHRIGCIDKCG